jgi:hypothetical protein
MILDIFALLFIAVAAGSPPVFAWFATRRRGL